MQTTTKETLVASERPTAEPEAGAGGADTRQRLAELEALIVGVAAKAVELGVPPGAFLGAVHAAYLNANPAFRESLENTQLLAQVAELRRRGRVGEA